MSDLQQTLVVVYCSFAIVKVYYYISKCRLHPLFSHVLAPPLMSSGEELFLTKPGWQAPGTGPCQWWCHNSVIPSPGRLA